MSCAKIDPALHQPQIKVRLPSNPVFFSTKALSSDAAAHGLRERPMPEPVECWSHGTATVMIAGDRCTRRLRILRCFDSKALSA